MFLHVPSCFSLVYCVALGFTNKNGIVFDPFMGSGTTFESCMRNNRFCVGFEILPEYCEIAKNRIISAQNEIEYSLNQLELGDKEFCL